MRKITHYTSFIGARMKKACGILVLLMILSTHFVQAQTSAEYQVKAVFLFNFTRFVDWPSAAFESTNSPFIIGILGDDPFGNYIDETVSGESTGGHPIIIKRYKTVKDIDNCHVLYIHSVDDESIRLIIADTKTKNVLTVSDANHFASLGGVIGFFLENNKIRMQINQEAAKSASLNISSKLLGVAKVL
ncbi:MAG: YfiR family protein [Ferruginibacter sp.]